MYHITAVVPALGPASGGRRKRPRTLLPPEGPGSTLGCLAVRSVQKVRSRTYGHIRQNAHATTTAVGIFYFCIFSTSSNTRHSLIYRCLLYNMVGGTRANRTTESTGGAASAEVFGPAQVQVLQRFGHVRGVIHALGLSRRSTSTCREDIPSHLTRLVCSSLR